MNKIAESLRDSVLSYSFSVTELNLNVNIKIFKTNIDGRETEKTDDKKDESEDAGKDESKEKTPLVEPEKVSYVASLCHC